MIVGLDSSFPPSSATAKAAKKGGVDLWSGYISTAPYDSQSHFGLYHPWPRAGFEAARLCGSTPIAFCSGWDSPGGLKALAAAWNVRLCLDIEGGIRGDGPWKQAWLDASGAGVYGNAPCHNCRAAFHVLAAYPGSGDVRATWWNASPRPPGPSGWQWAGTHSEFGIGVDRGDYDDWFALGSHTGELDMPLFLRGPDGAVYIIGDNGKRHIQRPEYLKFATLYGGEAALKVQPVTVAELATIPDVPTFGMGGTTDLNPVLNAISALGKHLGIGNA